MKNTGFLLTIGTLMICCALPSHATTTCLYNFKTGSGKTHLSYCVTENGNILEIQTLFGSAMLGANGEGYGLCDQNIQPGGVNYTDYGVSDTGNWKNAVVLSHSLTSVKIARTTADGHWTITQTITIAPKTYSITVVMALRNNQAVADVAYLVRFADAEPGYPNINDLFVGGENSAVARESLGPSGLQLANVDVPPFSFWQGIVQSVSTGPNACAFAFNESNFDWSSQQFQGSIEMAYVGNVGAGQTKTVTLSYQAL